MSKQSAAMHHMKPVLLSRQTGRGVKAYCARSGQNTRLGQLTLIRFSQFLPSLPSKMSRPIRRSPPNHPSDAEKSRGEIVIFRSGRTQTPRK